MQVSDLQPLKTPSSTVVTLFGMLILVRDVHRQKAASPIVVTQFGILTFVRDLQWAYL